MNEIEAVTAIAPAEPAAVGAPPPLEGAPIQFGDLMAQSLAQMEQKVETANDLVRAFALDDSIPVHQVTIALEEARLAVELAVQVRTRLVEAYREIMNMQL